MRSKAYRDSLLSLAAIVFGAVCLPAPAAAVSSCNSIPGNLIVNCGFESGNFTGWEHSGNTTFDAVEASRFGFPGIPNSGNFFAALGPEGSNAFLSQTFVDNVGETLRIEFFLASDGRTPNDFNVSFDNISLLSLTNDGLHEYTDYFFTMTGTGLDTLTIGGFRNDHGFFNLDDVSVSSTSTVPEPGSVTLFGIALAGLAAVRRRRRAD